MASEAVTAINADLSIGGSAISHVRRVVINRTWDFQKYATNSTGGTKRTAIGNQDWNADADLLFPGGEHPTGLHEGSSASVIGTVHTGVTYTGSGIVTSIDNIEADIDGSGLVGATVHIEGNGPLVKG